jgi:hypothetical protein
MIILINLSFFGFSQENDINQIKTVESLLVQLIEKYEIDKDLLQYDSFPNIMRYLKYSFVENPELIEIVNDGYGNIIKINISETIKLSITPSFSTLHLTGGFTYCIGNLYLNELEYNFYLISRGYIRDDNNICFYYSDANENDYIYEVTYLINHYEILIVTKYVNTYGYMEDPRLRISRTIYFDNREEIIKFMFH